MAARVAESAERYGEDQVSVCSLTNAAVREAVGRVMPIDEENVTTLHARCKRSLHAPAPAESRVGEFISAYPRHADQIPLSLHRVSRSDDSTMAERMLSGGSGPTLYEKMDLFRQEMRPISTWDNMTREFHLHWTDWCAQIGHMDFTGWLETALEQHSLPPQQVLYVDEAQDHTPLQLQVIRNWPARQRHLIGDDDQNLYEWSGAIPKAFLSPELPPEQNMVLSQSYRVPREVHSLATKMISQVSMRYPKEYKPRDADGKVFRGGDADCAAEWRSTIEDGSIMILTSCGYMLDGIISQMREEGIPFHNPYRKSNKKWNPLDTARTKMSTFL